MANHTNPHGGPYASKDPVLYTELNDLIDEVTASPNFDGGSAHAPTGDIALSGSMSHGFLFADNFPFNGEIDVSDGLTITSPVSGFIIFDPLVALDLKGPVTLKTGTSASITWESGRTATFMSGSTLTAATGSTTNLSGAVNFRGQSTFKSLANGGAPAQLLFEDGVLLHIDDNALLYIYTNEMRVRSGAVCTWENGCVATWESTSTSNVSGVWNFKTGCNIDFEGGSSLEFESGSALSLLAGSTTVSAGTMLFSSGTYPTLSSRAWKRRATQIGGSTQAAYNDPDIIRVLDTTTAVPIFYTRPTTSTTEKSVLEFTNLIHGSTITTASIKCDGNSTDVSTYPTYRMVRWRDGTGAYENMSDLVNDAHNGTGDWGANPRTTTITINAHAVIDEEYRYGLRVFHPAHATTASMSIFDVYAEGTLNSIQR